MTGPPPSPVPGEPFARAVAYALAVHADQRRKGTEISYVGHLLGVAGLVIDAGGDETAAIAGLLHDTAEDRGGVRRLADIEARFGADVASIVRDCSDSLAAQTEEKAPWRERKQRYLDHLADVGGPTLLVSLADKVHNARAILADQRRVGDEVFTRFTVGRAQGPADGRVAALWYYDSLLERFRERARDLPTAGAHQLLDELGRTVAAIHAHPGTAGT